MAVIYHRMGNNDKAYEYMAKFKKINDSIVLVSHGNVVASCYVQMNNERLKLEQKMLEAESARWKSLFFYTLAGAIVIALAIFLWLNRQRIRRLELEKVQLIKARKKAEKAFDMKNEFINSITNELREPLNPIEGFSEILGTKDYALQPEEREQLGKMISRCPRTTPCRPISSVATWSTPCDPYVRKVCASIARPNCLTTTKCPRISKRCSLC